ncbi:MAG: DUF87 domain-containing protein [Clostridiales Family XIII bacterium]|jgi:hypothetical protein|nr:DUF87 domain-containing protein [Clostridiales Family XIII bacterium]
MRENALLTVDCEKALAHADAIVSGGYLEALARLPVVAPSAQELDFDAAKYGRFYRLKRLVINKEENFSDKLVTVVNVAASQGCTLVTVIESDDGASTHYFIGILPKHARMDTPNDAALRDAAGNAFSGAMEGNFVGSEMDCLDANAIGVLQERVFRADRCVSAVSGLVAPRGKDAGDVRTYVQGMENLVNSMRGRKYAVVMIADAVSGGVAREKKRGYEMIHTQLSSLLRQTLTLSESDTVTLSEARSESVARGIAEGISKTQTRGGSYGFSEGKQSGMNLSFFLGTSLGSQSGMTSGSSESLAEGRSRQETEQRQSGISSSEAKATGRGRSLQLTSENRSVKSMLDRIDMHIKRIEQCESFGAFDCATYIVADDRADALAVASNYNALLRGEESFLQSTQINTWANTNTDRENTGRLLEYLRVFAHPSFRLDEETKIEVRPSLLIGGRETAIQFGLPKKSINGLTVLEMTPFGRNAPRPASSAPPLSLGKLCYMGREESASVMLDPEKLCAHVFVTGSTGAGKSNAICRLLAELRDRENPVPFLVIEPVKGEYKHAFHRNARVYGTNDRVAPLLRINPFAFPPAVHVLEHIDRLVEIFNVCWPMYAAMPAVLKDATLRAYETCGWDLSTSRNRHSEGVFPTFTDLREALTRVIEGSAYSEELKGNYLGALDTRVNSLTNGLNRWIFSAEEIGDAELFDKNAIVDLSRVGSSETKALIMGVLVMRLSEHRMAQGGVNRPLRHVTVLEEAHNLLRRASLDPGVEGGGPAAKSVEMLSNAIAEMRTYGEGFIIADQAPGLLDLSAIRNTNTKILLRIPEQSDRLLAGRAAGLSDGQIAELAKLNTGVAAVYQNGWLEAVLCKIEKFDGEESPYTYANDAAETPPDRIVCVSECLKLLLRDRVAEAIDADIDEAASADILRHAGLSAKNRLEAERRIRTRGAETEGFDTLADIVAELLDARRWIADSVRAAVNFRELQANMLRRIRERTEGLSTPLLIETAHALMRSYAGEGAKQAGVYEGWHRYVEAHLPSIL